MQAPVLTLEVDAVPMLAVSMHLHTGQLFAASRAANLSNSTAVSLEH